MNIPLYNVNLSYMFHLFLVSFYYFVLICWAYWKKNLIHYILYDWHVTLDKSNVHREHWSVYRKVENNLRN